MPFKPADVRRVHDALLKALPENFSAAIAISPSGAALTVRIPDPKNFERTVASASWEYQTTKRMMNREQPLAADLAQTVQGLAVACGQYPGR